MSEFSVAPEHLIAAAGRLSAISGDVEDSCLGLRGCSGAAAGTPAEGAFEGLLGHFSAVLPHFGLAGERLGAAVTGAGSGYARSDDEVAGACQGGEQQR
jgi:hypothetical protein